MINWPSWTPDDPRWKTFSSPYSSYAKLPRKARLGPIGSWNGASATMQETAREGRWMDVIQRHIVKGTQDNGLIDLTVERDDDFKTVTVKIDGKPVTTYRGGSDGVTSVDVREQENVTIGGDIKVTAAKSEEFQSAWLADAGTNWRVEKDEVVFTYPHTGASISLPKVKPGKYNPVGIQPVYGNPEMIFSIVMGIKHKRHTILSGPTGTGKTTAYAFIAELLGYNFLRFQIDPKTEGAALIGEYLPAGTGTFAWTDGPLTEAVRLSLKHPTIFVFDELSRIGNVAELARTYSLLDDGFRLNLVERQHELGNTEILEAKDLYIGATMNPADDEGADYIGVRELDPALMSRFSFSPLIKYPEPEIEVKTLLARVPGLDQTMAARMVDIGNAIRESDVIHYPFSFRELIAWGEAIPYYSFQDAAKVAFINKAHVAYRPDLLNRTEMAG